MKQLVFSDHRTYSSAIHNGKRYIVLYWSGSNKFTTDITTGNSKRTGETDPDKKFNYLQEAKDHLNNIAFPENKKYEKIH